MTPGARGRGREERLDRGRPRIRRRMPRWPWVILAMLVIATPVLGLGVAWWGSGILLKPHHNLKTSAGTVQAVGSDTVTLPAKKSTRRVGTYGLQWKGGHATIGPTSAHTSQTVTRSLSDVSGPLKPGTSVDLNTVVWPSNPRSGLGIDYTNVAVPDPLGPMPAWFVPGSGSTWVIFVHGIDGERQAGLRPLPTLVAAGYPTLMITYRNDAGAPASPDGLSHLGMTEWQDLESAATYALHHGAKHFLLYGDSMGGAIVARFMHVSEYASRVTGIVFDAPALDWGGILQNQLDRLGLGVLGPQYKEIVSWRGDLSLPALDELRNTGVFDGLPILLFQGLADPLVPPAESKRFAEEVGAEYVTFPHAGHIQSWNTDPQRYDTTLANFLKKHFGR